MIENFDIYFLGGVFPKEKIDEILNNSIGSVQNAANNLQYNYINGLEQNLKRPIKIINSLFVGSYPKRYRKLFIKSYKFENNLSTENINVGYFNLTLIKFISRYYTLKRAVRNNILKEPSKRKVVIAYSMSFIFTLIFSYLKKNDNDIITILIVPDLPQYMNLSNNKNIIYRIFKNIEIKIINKDLGKIDGFVLITEQMSKVLNISSHYKVIEGMIDTEDYEIVHKNEENSILYSGSLLKQYGVLDLIDAFERVNDIRYKLIICGTGDCENEIIKASIRNKSIVYLGQLRNDEVKKLQRKVKLLINPRKNVGEYTKYSFPSKIIEYMSSGTPLISFMLNGMPEEYRKYIIEIKNEEDSIYKTLKLAFELSQDELTKLGHEAMQFTKVYKNTLTQTAKVLDLIHEIQESKCINEPFVIKDRIESK